jgi:hypothetical protein
MIPDEPMSAAGVLLTLALSLMVVACISAAVFKSPKLIAYGFLGVVLLFADATYGRLGPQGSIYGRGSGIFYFSLLHLGLIASGFALLCKKLASPHPTSLAPPMTKWFVCLVFLMFAHVVVGLMQGVALNVILGYNGIINILNMLVFMYILIEAFKSDSDKYRLLYAIMALATARAVFGLVRYAFFGGDDANPYKNFDNLNIKLVFFEIGDNFVLALGAFCAAWLLMASPTRLSNIKRTMMLFMLIMPIAAIGLSFRRSSLIGLALMFGLLIIRLPGAKRVVVMLFTAGFITAIAGVFFQQRLQHVDNGAANGGVVSSLVFDIARDNVEDNRFYELYAAAKSLGSNWPIGLGSWGTFVGDDELLAYHGGRYDFIHSGFGHILLKSGVVGLLLFCGLIFAYIGHYRRTRKYLTGNAILLSDAGFAGFLFWLPTLLIGTPIIEFRTMLLLGLTLAMPFIAVHVSNARRPEYNYAPQYAAV